MTRPVKATFVTCSLLATLALACGSCADTDDAQARVHAGASGAGGDAGASGNAGSSGQAPRPRIAVEAAAFEPRSEVTSAMRAALEMQLSGEPLAEAMGRDLAGYQRHDIRTDRYYADDPAGVVDLVGYSTGVESYEYSKLAMNALSLESGASVSLAFGPLTNPDNVPGVKGSFKLRNELQFYAASTDADGYVFLTDAFDTKNPLGWPGLWPSLHPFRSCAPAVAPEATFLVTCSLASDDTPLVINGPISPDYECESNTLRLVDRDAQCDKVIGPGPSGWLAWKQALWATNYTQVLHDLAGNLVASVPEEDLERVGGHQNTVVGALDDGSVGVAGTYLGSSSLEGFQAGLFLRSLDNQAAHFLFALGTADGTSLSGFPDLDAALAYTRASPLRWLPAEIAVTETPADVPFFPQPSYTLSSPESRLLDLAGLIGAYAELYSITDRDNPASGGTQTMRGWFDGKPFPEDDPQSPVDATIHDRALVFLRFLLLTLDRVHRAPGGPLLDVAHPPVAPAASAPDARSSTTGAAYALVALRHARLALTHRLALYANTSPDTAGLTTALDAFPLGGAGEATVGELLSALIRDEAQLLRDRLTTADGTAYAWLQAGAPSGADSLDAHAAAARGLYAAYLATGDVSYRDRAAAVVTRMNQRFWDDALAIYVDAPAPRDEVTYTPERFSLVQGALREHYLHWASRPGHESESPVLLSRLARLNKLVLNGWDDRDGDEQVDWPDECVRVEGGLPRGGLQMAERSLTGELGSVEADASTTTPTPTSDRDQDCVPEIDDARLPAQLAGSLTLRARRP